MSYLNIQFLKENKFLVRQSDIIHVSTTKANELKIIRRQWLWHVVTLNYYSTNTRYRVVKEAKKRKNLKKSGQK